MRRPRSVRRHRSAARALADVGIGCRGTSPAPQPRATPLQRARVEARTTSSGGNRSKRIVVALTGLGTPNQMREYVEDGTVTAFALWNPADLGYLAAYAAQALVTGEIAGDEGDTFDAGDLGSYEVGADGVVLLGDPYVFDADNIGDFDF